uniref:Integrase core domain containing protein n=1 Tax=Solanum tuberosum TaxID=4113 RepID=M1DFJ0_SOLTU
MARDPGTYSGDIVREFYAFYVATLRGSIHKNARPTAQAPLTVILVCKFSVDISETTIRRFLYGPGPDHSWALNTAEFDYRSDSADNALTWDRAVMVAVLVTGFEIDFACMLIAEIQEMAFKASTTYPFPCLIFQLCRDSGVPIWHCDKLIWPIGTLDIGLIRDEVNMAAPCRESHVDLPPMGADSVDVVEQMQGDDPTPPAHTNDVPASSSQATLGLVA